MQRLSPHLVPVRPWRVVPRYLVVLFAAAIGAQLAWQARAPHPAAAARALPPAPPAAVLRLAALGEASTLASGLVLWLQQQDDQPGARQSFHDLDYDRLRDWLRAILAVDPASDYPLMLAVRVYGQVVDPRRQRVMFDFVRDAYVERPAERWRWLAEAAILARHRIGDLELALGYASTLAEHVEGTDIPVWARELQVLVLEEMGEYEAARILLGGLIDAGEVDDPRELRFLERRLQRLKQRTDRD